MIDAIQDRISYLKQDLEDTKVTRPRLYAAAGLGKQFAIGAKETVLPDVGMKDVALNAILSANPLLAMLAPGILERQEIGEKFKTLITGRTEELLEEQTETIQTQNTYLEEQSDTLQDIDDLSRQTVNKLDDLQDSLLNSQPIDLDKDTVDKLTSKDDIIVEELKTQSDKLEELDKNIKVESVKNKSKFTKLEDTTTLLSKVLKLAKYGVLFGGTAIAAKKLHSTFVKPKEIEKIATETQEELPQTPITTIKERVVETVKEKTPESLKRKAQETKELVSEKVKSLKESETGQKAQSLISNTIETLKRPVSITKEKLKNINETIDQNLKNIQTRITEIIPQSVKKIGDEIVSTIQTGLDKIRDQYSKKTHEITTEKFKNVPGSNIAKEMLEEEQTLSQKVIETVKKQTETAVEKVKQIEVSEIAKKAKEKFQESKEFVTEKVFTNVKEKFSKTEEEKPLQQKIEEQTETNKNKGEEQPTNKIKEASKKVVEKIKNYDKKAEVAADVLSMAGYSTIGTGLRIGKHIKEGDKKAVVRDLVYLTPAGSLLILIDTFKGIKNLIKKKTEEDKSIQEEAENVKEKVQLFQENINVTGQEVKNILHDTNAKIEHVNETIEDTNKKLKEKRKEKEKSDEEIIKDLKFNLVKDFASRHHLAKMALAAGEGKILPMIWGAVGMYAPIVYYSVEMVKFTTSTMLKVMSKSPVIAKQMTIGAMKLTGKVMEFVSNTVQRTLNIAGKIVVKSRDIAFSLTNFFMNGIKGLGEIFKNPKKIKELKLQGLSGILINTFKDSLKSVFSAKTLEDLQNAFNEHIIGSLKRIKESWVGKKVTRVNEKGEVIGEKREPGYIHESLKNIKEFAKSTYAGGKELLKNFIFETPQKTQQEKNLEEIAKDTKESKEIQQKSLEVTETVAEKQGFIEKEKLKEMKKQTSIFFNISDKVSRIKSTLKTWWNKIKKWRLFDKAKDFLLNMFDPFKRVFSGIAGGVKDLMTSVFGAYAGTKIAGGAAKGAAESTIISRILSPFGKAASWIARAVSGSLKYLVANPQLLVAAMVFGYTAWKLWELKDSIVGFFKTKHVAEKTEEHRKIRDAELNKRAYNSLSEEAKEKFGDLVLKKGFLAINELVAKGALIRHPEKRYYMLPRESEIEKTKLSSIKTQAQKLKEVESKKEIISQEKNIVTYRNKYSLKQKKEEVSSPHEIQPKPTKVTGEKGEEESKLPKTLTMSSALTSTKMEDFIKSNKGAIAGALLTPVLTGLPDTGKLGIVKKLLAPSVSTGLSMVSAGAGVVKGAITPQERYWGEKKETSVWDIISPYRWGLNAVEGVKFALKYKKEVETYKDLVKVQEESKKHITEIQTDLISRLSDKAKEKFLPELEQTSHPDILIAKLLTEQSLVRGSDKKFYLPSEEVPVELKKKPEFIKFTRQIIKPKEEDVFKYTIEEQEEKNKILDKISKVLDKNAEIQKEITNNSIKTHNNIIQQTSNVINNISSAIEGSRQDLGDQISIKFKEIRFYTQKI